MCSGHNTLGAGAKTLLESRIKKFTPRCVFRYNVLDAAGNRARPVVREIEVADESEPEVKLRSPHERFCLADFQSDLKKMDNSAKPTDTIWNNTTTAVTIADRCDTTVFAWLWALLANCFCANGGAHTHV